MKTKIRVKKLSKRQVTVLLAEGGWSKDEELSNRSFCVYIDARNRALEVLSSSEDGNLYEDLEDLVRVVKIADSQPTGPLPHILEGRLAHGADFVAHVPELVASLPRLLGLEVLPPCTLDGLAIVDDAVRRVGYSRCMKQELFSALVAYAGEVMRAFADGEWFSVQSGGVAEPWIRGAIGLEYPVFAIVYKALRHRSKGSILGAVDGSLKSHRLGLPGHMRTRQ